MIQLLIALVFSFNAFPANELITQRDGDNLKITTETLGVPHKQLTYQGRNKAHLETGNKNLLANPGFEHETITSGWVLSCTDDAIAIATPDSDAGRPSHFGKKTLNLEVMGMDTGGTCVFYQDVETGWVGDYLHSIWAKADTADKVKVYYRKNQEKVEDAFSFLEVLANEWKEYPLQKQSGDTHSGIMVEITVNAGEIVTVLLDEASVKPHNPAIKLSYGECDTKECATSFSAKINASGSVYDESHDFITSCSYVDAGDLNCSLNAFLTAPNCVVSARPEPAVPENVYAVSIQALTYNSIEMKFQSLSNTEINGPVDIICEKRGVDLTAAFQARKDFADSKLSILTSSHDDYTRIGEVIYSTASTAPEGFISAMGVSIGKSSGDHTGDSYYRLYEVLWAMDGLSTTAGHPFVISSAKGATALADWDAGKTITIDWRDLFMRVKGSSRTLGSYEADAFQGHWHQMYGRYGGGANGPTVNLRDGEIYTYGTGKTVRQAISDGVNGTPRVDNETRPKNGSLNAYIRFRPESRILTADLTGIEKCEDSYECTDTFSGLVNGSGDKSQENLPWIESCTVGTHDRTCTIKEGVFSVSPNMGCTINTTDTTTGDLSCRIHSVTPTSFSIRTCYAASTGDVCTTKFTSFVTANKRGADYIGKTAKAVASDQNVRSVGSIGVDIQSVYFGGNSDCSSACSSSPCVICNQVGNKITSISHHGLGDYRVNGIDGTKYNCFGQAFTTALVSSPVLHRRNASTSTYAAINTSNHLGSWLDAALASVTCIGIP